MNIGIILAGGNGKRMNNNTPKQFLELYDKPIIVYTLEVCTAHPKIDYTVIAAHKDWISFTKELVEKYHLPKCFVIEGGDTRQESTLKSLEYLKKKGVKDNDIILTHDAVRPFWDNRIITESITEAKKYGAVDICVKTHDTMVQANKNLMIKGFPKRDELYNGQTPQTFKYKTILDSHRYTRNNNIACTCDCSVALAAGNPVKIVIGDYENIKLTTPSDFDLAYRILEKRETKNEPKL